MRMLCVVAVGVVLGIIGTAGVTPAADARDVTRPAPEVQRSSRGTRAAAQARREGRAARPPGHEAGEHSARAQRGRASYYSPAFNGRRMANGRRFDPRSDSAANRALPLGTRARVTNLENGRTQTVTIEDRGPHVPGRILDVSPRTAGELGMRERGVAPVEVVPTELPRAGGDAAAGATSGGGGRAPARDRR